MKNYKEFIKCKFDNFKRKDTKLPMICFPIVNDKQDVVAFLKPIPKDFRIIFPGLIQLLGRWRKENPSLSESIFEITDKRTENWLDNLIINRDDRLLFLIDSVDNLHIGHIAYSSFNYIDKSAEIDCVLRGVKNACPGLMTYAVKTMLKWGYSEFKIKKFYLSTSKDNTKAIDLYKRCGFKIIKEIPLVRHELLNEVRWDPSEEENVIESEKYAVKMKYMGD